MVKSINAKFLRPLLLLICFALFCCLSGCGNKESAATDVITTTGTDYISNLDASPPTVSGGQMSVITASVDSPGTLNETITFTIPVNNSGASFIDSGGASVSTITIPMQLGMNFNTTISVMYKAGTNVSGTNVQDMVKATLGNGSTLSTLITLTGSANGTGFQMTVSATPPSLAAGAMSVLIAQVYNPDSTPAIGQSVTFGFVTNNSGAPALSVVSGTTDSTGQAVAVYTAGNNDTSKSIQDVFQASLSGGEAGAAIITILPQAGTGNRIKSFTQDPATSSGSPIVPPYHQVVMKVTVTTDDNTTPVVGKVVTFSIIAGSGTLSAATATTDDNGEAYVLFTRPETGSGDTVVKAQIEGTTYGGDAASIVYWTGAASAASITLSANPYLMNAGNLSTITATVLDGLGNGVSGLTVTFNLTVNNSGGSFSSGSTILTTTATTNTNGKAVVIYYSGPTGGVSDSITATVSSGGNVYTAAENIGYY
jgi:hypothetical protein